MEFCKAFRNALYRITNGFLVGEKWGTLKTNKTVQETEWNVKRFALKMRFLLALLPSLLPFWNLLMQKVEYVVRFCPVFLDCFFSQHSNHFSFTKWFFEAKITMKGTEARTRPDAVLSAQRHKMVPHFYVLILASSRHESPITVYHCKKITSFLLCFIFTQMFCGMLSHSCF